MRTILVSIQAASFVGLGFVLLRAGDTKLGLAQMCLAVVTALVYL